VNGLAFPDVAEGMVVFGLGYGLELLSSAVWMQGREIYYWGDIDTHGFAMLDRLRAIFPAARSLLIYRETFLAHRALWVREDTPFAARSRGSNPRSASYSKPSCTIGSGTGFGPSRSESRSAGFGKQCRILPSQSRVPESCRL
jgi:hypothetical protein